MKTNRTQSMVLALGLALVMNLAWTAQAAVIAHWRMESQMTTTSTCFSGTKGVADSATSTGQGTLQGSCTGVLGADDPLITFNGNGDTVSISSTVPPTNMFNSGFSGGAGSYNAEAIAAVDGALFFPQDRYGDEFTSASWTFEMFIKANGNQSGGGFMQLMKNDEAAWTYGLVLNESSAGGLRLFVQNSQGFPTVDLTDRNYADGNWYYIVCSYDQPTKKLTIRVRGQDGIVSKNYKILSSDPFNTAAGNLFLGRNTYNNADRRTFRGLMDEVRISNAALTDDALIGKINPDGTNVVAHWRFESVLTSGSATNFARFQDYAISTGQGTGVGGGGATLAQDYLNIYPGDTGVALSNTVSPSSMFQSGLSGGTNSYYCQNSTATAVFDPVRFGDEMNTRSWTLELFYKSNGNQAGSDTSETNRMQLIRNGAYYWGVVANEAAAGSLRLFAQQTDGTFRFVDLTNRNYSDGTWQYLVCTYDQPTKKLMLRVRSENGLISSNSFTLTADPKSTPEVFSIGAVDSGGARRVRGWMDEVRFSDNVQPDSALMGILKADSTNVLSTSANPALLGGSITFTSVVSAAVSGNGTPTGVVQFRTNGVALGSPVTLVSGMATISTTTLPMGPHTVQVEYAGDGSFSGSTNSLTQVVKGSSTVAMISSVNPSLPGSNVVFTATVIAVGPATNTPTGDVVFLGNGTPFSTNTLSGAGTSAEASANIATLPHGSNTVTAQFAGDANLHGDTNSVAQIVNQAPVAQDITLGVMLGEAASCQVIGGGKYPATDADGDSLSVTAVGIASSGTSGFTSSNITYTADGSLGTNTFTYTITDALGATDTKTVTVIVMNPQGFNLLSATADSGLAYLTYLGIPGTSYALDWATNLTPPLNWTAVATNVAGTNGFLCFTNPISLAPTNDFYRTRYVP